MPSFPYLAFELSAYVLAFFCFRHAWKRGRQAALVLLAGMVYGVLLEYAAILAYDAYSYGHFLVMFGNTVPLCIGVLWGVIFYAGIEVTERLGMPGALQLFFPALLAFSIDISLDPVAVHLGFWTWRTSSSRLTLWNVPLYNFYTWMLVPFSFALMLALGRALLRSRRWGLRGDVGLALLLPPLSVFTLFALFRVHGFVMGLMGDAVDPFAIFLPAAIVGIILASLSFARRYRLDQPLDVTILAVPLFFHVFCLLALLLSGYFRQNPRLLASVVGMLLVSTGLFLWPYWLQLPFFRRRVSD